MQYKLGKKKGGRREGGRWVTPEELPSETGSWQAMKAVFFIQLKFFLLIIIILPYPND